MAELGDAGAEKNLEDHLVQWPITSWTVPIVAEDRRGSRSNSLFQVTQHNRERLDLNFGLWAQNSVLFLRIAQVPSGM